MIVLHRYVLSSTYTYTFSHWADENGKEVKFPIEVEADATYYAQILFNVYFNLLYLPVTTNLTTM